MAITFTADEQARRVYASASGELTLTEILRFIDTARQPLERREWPLLVDARGACTRETPAAVGVVVERVKAISRTERFSRGHVALVADDDHLFALFLDYETQLADAGIRLVRVFRQPHDAERWLSVMSSSRRFR